MFPYSEAEVASVLGDRPEADPHGEQQVLQRQLAHALRHLSNITGFNKAGEPCRC